MPLGQQQLLGGLWKENASIELFLTLVESGGDEGLL